MFNYYLLITVGPPGTEFFFELSVVNFQDSTVLDILMTIV